MQTKLLSFFILVIVAIVTIFYYSRSKNQEHFVIKPEVNKLLRDTYGDETCSVMQMDSLTGDGKMMAKQYIDTNRIRVWKPTRKDQVAIDGACYVNYDPDNNIQDYILADRKCDMSEPLFQNTPFITNVFEDNMPEKTKSTSVNKCVIEIDESKITEDALQTFWNKVGSSDCIQLNKSIIELNTNLKKKLEKSQSLFTAFQAQYNDQAATLVEQKKRLEGLRARLAILVKTIDKKEKEYQTLMGVHNNKQVESQKLNNSYKNQISQSTRELKNAREQWEALSATLTATEKSYAIIIEKKDIISELLDTLTKSFMFITNQVNKLEVEVKNLTITNENLLKAIVKADAEIEQCEYDIKTCNLLKVCQSEVKQLDIQLAELNKRLQELTRQKYNSSVNTARFVASFKQCAPEVGTLNAKITAQLAEIERLKAMKVTNCEEYIQMVKALTDYKNELLEKCKRYSNANLKSAVLADNLRADVTDGDANANACTNRRREMPVVVKKEEDEEWYRF